MKRIGIPGNEFVQGVTKLPNEIYVLCLIPNIVCCFEDRNPFRLQRNISITEIQSPWDIASSEKDNCLYVSDFVQKCVWKITRETSDHYNIIKWLSTENAPFTMSSTQDGQLLLVTQNSPNLWIYGSDAELIKSVQLPKEIGYPHHAVKTSMGNFIVIHFEKPETISLPDSFPFASATPIARDFEVSEVSRDGQLITRSFIPEEIDYIIFPYYLSLDSDDRVFVADKDNHRVILLGFDLKWNRILCPAKEEVMIQLPWRLHFDEVNKQLIVGGDAVYVYNLSQK